MIDDTQTTEGRTEAAATSGPDVSSRAGFCQECGRALSPLTLQRVGNGIFCEPCATLQRTGRGWQPVSAGGYPGAGRPGAAPSPGGEPNPVLAGILGLIPGVGAMYNAQYAKGAMHLIVFVVLVTLADNLNWVLWWLVWGWIFYQAFDAYHTARARRDNVPPPNPFGWNDIGDRFGYVRPTPPQPTYAGNRETQGRRPGANWAGYVPPAEPVTAAYPPPFSESANHNPYTAPYTAPYATPDSASVPPVVPPMPPPGIDVQYARTFTGGVPGRPEIISPAICTTRRFPLGALWLIGLGMLFLFGNLVPEWRLSGRWLVPVLLAALSLWTAVRRIDLLHGTASGISSLQVLAGAMIGPALLFTVSALLALQAGHVILMRRSWPVLLVVWGAMLLLQRSGGTLALPQAPVETATATPPPVRSTSGTGSLGL